jgi:hypothetical protein
MKTFALALLLALSLVARAQPVSHLEDEYNIESCTQASPPSWCAGADIGAWVNHASAAGATSILIPDASYSWTTPISITLAATQKLTIHCPSRNATLNYTGPAPDAFYWTSGGSPIAGLRIENCTFNGAGASPGANGLHSYYAQNLLLSNAVFTSFPALNFYGQGLIDSLVLMTDFLNAGAWNYKLEPDTTHSFASNANRVIGGSMQYGKAGNWWDAGISSAWGSNTGNGLIAVTLEEQTNVPQFVVEGTWNDYIRESYIEYGGGFTTSIANLYLGWVGNYSGSGVGSSATYTAKNFNFENNFLTTPKAGSGFTTASLFAANSWQLRVDSLTDVGAPAFGIVFYSGGANTAPTSSAMNIGWQKALYQNPPPSGYLMQTNGQPIVAGEYGLTSNGIMFGGGFSGTKTAGSCVLTINGGLITGVTGC